MQDCSHNPGNGASAEAPAANRMPASKSSEGPKACSASHSACWHWQLLSPHDGSWVAACKPAACIHCVGSMQGLCVPGSQRYDMANIFEGLLA